MAKQNGEVIRIDSELADQIRDFANKNNMKIKEASKEIAKMNKAAFSNKKILKEIKF